MFNKFVMLRLMGAPNPFMSMANGGGGGGKGGDGDGGMAGMMQQQMAMIEQQKKLSDMAEVALRNIQKLSKRKTKGTIQGSGDDR